MDMVKMAPNLNWEGVKGQQTKDCAWPSPSSNRDSRLWFPHYVQTLLSTIQNQKHLNPLAESERN